MRIIPYESAYREPVIRQFVAEYSEDGRRWSDEASARYLFGHGPESLIAFVAVDEVGAYMGGIFGNTEAYYTASAAYVSSLQVIPECRGRGIGTALLSAFVAEASRRGVTVYRLLADGRKGFPREWYGKMGFTETGWIEMEVQAGALRLR